MNKQWVMLAALAGMALAGCNSGGGGGDAQATTTPSGASTAAGKVGVFLDAPVQGLRVVRADGSSATTGRWGEFSYADGEMLTFYLGNLRLGAVAGKAEVTPLDLFSASSSNDRRVTNLLRLLQSLDSNDNTTDGIQLPNLTTLAAETAAVKLDLDTTSFEKDAGVASLLAKKRPGLTLVGLSTAQAHFDATRSAASKVGWWNGTLTFQGKAYAIQGLSGVSSDFSGTYKAANGKSYSVLINGTGNKAQITVTTYTTLANGAFLPDVETESGNLQQNQQNWVFNGVSGTRLEIAKTNPAAYVGTIGYYGVNASASANLCPNGGFMLQPGADAGIPSVIYIGMAYLDTNGLRYAIKPLLSIGGDSVYSGALTISNDKLQFALPGGTLSIARSNIPGLGLPSCN